MERIDQHESQVNSLKGYLNDFQSVITKSVIAEEDESLLRERFSVIRTETESENFRLYIEEGLKWMKRKWNGNQNGNEKENENGNEV